MKKTLIAISLILVILVAGCTSEEVVEDAAPEEMELACPDSCTDANDCTKDSCSKETDYKCVHEPIVPCCGNTVCENTLNETPWSCSADCGEPECYTSGDCDDDEDCTTDACTNGICTNQLEPGCKLVVVPDLDIIHKSSYRTQDGTLHVMGEVKNNGGTAFKDVNVNIILYSLSGKNLLEENVAASVKYVKVNGITPFIFEIENAPFDHYYSEITASGTETTKSAPGDFMIYKDVLTTIQGDNFVNGEVRNTGSKAMSGVEVVVTYYSQKGNVIGVAVDDPTSTYLAPNEAGVFNASIRYTPTGIDTYSIVAQGDLA